MKGFIALIIMISGLFSFTQTKEIEILKSQNGNIITYYAKSNVRDQMTVEFSITGTGFTSSVPDNPIKVDLKAFEKKELTKLILDPKGNSINVGLKFYKSTNP
jgi:hypothetical protein